MINFFKAVWQYILVRVFIVAFGGINIKKVFNFTKKKNKKLIAWSLQKDRETSRKAVIKIGEIHHD